MPKNIRRIKKRGESEIHIHVQEAVDNYLQTTHVKTLSPTTQFEYHIELNCFARWCAEHVVYQNTRKRWIAEPLTKQDEHSPVMLHQVNDQVVYLHLEHIKSTHKPSRKDRTEISTYTLAGVVRVIKTFLNWCVLDALYCNHVKAITVQRIEKPPVIETIINTFTPEQIGALFKACEKEESEHLHLRGKAIISILLDAGLRASELCSLTIGNVSLDPKDAYVRVLGKGSKWGEVGLGEQSRRHIQKYIRMFREPTIEHEVRATHPNATSRELKKLVQEKISKSVVFMSRNGGRLTSSGLTRIVRRLGEWAHIKESDVRCTPHTFRHTFAKLFILNGGDIYILSKLLRHSSLAVTEEYLKSLKQSEARHKAKSVLDNL